MIVGPGNRYVAIAERLVAGEGVVGRAVGVHRARRRWSVVADASTPVAYAAIDLVVQAEHGPDGLAYLITWSEPAAAAIGAEVARIADASPRRAEILATLRAGRLRGAGRRARAGHGGGQRHRRRAPRAAQRRPRIASCPLVRSAGAVFLGPWAPASVGDYIAGPNHVLPTARSARFGSALRVDDFRKHIHVVERRPGRAVPAGAPRGGPGHLGGPARPRRLGPDPRSDPGRSRTP